MRAADPPDGGALQSSRLFLRRSSQCQPLSQHALASGHLQQQDDEHCQHCTCTHNRSLSCHLWSLAAGLPTLLWRLPMSQPIMHAEASHADRRSELRKRSVGFCKLTARGLCYHAVCMIFCMIWAEPDAGEGRTCDAAIPSFRALGPAPLPHAHRGRQHAAFPVIRLQDVLHTACRSNFMINTPPMQSKQCRMHSTPRCSAFTLRDRRL